MDARTADAIAHLDRQQAELAEEKFHIGDEVTLDGASAWIVVSRERVDPTNDNVTYEISNLLGQREVAQERYLELVQPGPYVNFR
jgi:hypothetical protein